MRVRFIYKKKPRQFNYNPRYYDPEKEARDRRRDELIGARPSEGDYVPGSIIKSKASVRYSEQQGRRKTQKGGSLKLIVMLVAVFAVAAWLIFF